MGRLLVSIALLAPPPATAQNGAALEGGQIVDLSSEASKPYTKVLILRLAADGTVRGFFYDSDIQAGRWKTDRGRICVSFRTTDGSGFYHTSACLRGGALEGQTWAEQRAFVFNWNARRVY